MRQGQRKILRGGERERKREIDVDREGENVCEREREGTDIQRER